MGFKKIMEKKVLTILGAGAATGLATVAIYFLSKKAVTDEVLEIIEQDKEDTNKAKEKVAEVINELKETVEEIKEEAKNTKEKVEEKVEEKIEKVEEKIEEVVAEIVEEGDNKCEN